ncbi:MAG TPA: tetratricopeptide repeat protein [Pyrinomonadaceae bacterium]
MAFEKAKVLKAAEKFLSQGKINAAIKEYRQIVDHEPDDLTTLNMLGDLYARAGKKEEAITCFERIAEHYAAQEFNLKAIAMYKKIERLKPRDPVVANKLADLYATQGLVVDARAQYLIVADAFTRSGDNRKALDILHKIADLDPNNTEIRLKLADGYLKESMRREAASAFVQAANRLQQVGSLDRALEAYTKALQLVPDDFDGLRGMLETHIARGTADEAAEVLESVVQDREDDRDLVPMLARAYLAAEDPAGAERATAMWMAQDTTSYLQVLPVARLYLKLGKIDDSIRALTGIIERMLAGREEKELLEIVDGVLERNPDHVEALRMLVRVYWWQRDMDALRSALERLAESAEASELVDEERYALTQLVRLAPDEQRYLDRLNLLGGLQDETSEDFSASTPAGEVPEFETFASTADEEPVANAAVEVVEFETNATPESSFVDPTSSFADLNEVADRDSFNEPEPAFQEVDFGSVSAAEPPSSPADEAERREAMMKQELESVDFYISQGYTDIAIDTLDVLEKQFGPHSEIETRRQKLGQAPQAAPPPPPPAVFEFGGVDELNETGEETVSLDGDMTFAFSDNGDPGAAAEPVSAKPANKGIDAGLHELFEEFRVAEEEDNGLEDFETHYNMGTAYKEMDLLDEAVQEFQTSVALVKPNDGTSRYLQCCNMLGHCFVQKGLPEAAIMWFKKGLAAPGHSEDEYQALRYELGGAYEELGELEQAKQYYTEVYGVDVNYREVAEKLSNLKAKK